jgi:hypothetical protein
VTSLKSRGVGGKKGTRRLSQVGDRVLGPRDPLTEQNRNGRRVLRRLRKKYGAETIDREMERLRK